MLSSSSGAKLTRVPVGSIELCHPPLIVEHEHDGGARIEILRNLSENLRPSVAGRQDLDNQVGRDIQVAIGQRPLRNPSVSVEANVRASHRVGTALGDDTRVVAEQMAKIPGVDLDAE